MSSTPLSPPINLILISLPPTTSTGEMVCFSGVVSAFDAGTVTSHNDGNRFWLRDSAIEARWTVTQNRLSDPLFNLRFADGSIVRSQDPHFAAAPTTHDLKALPTCLATRTRSMARRLKVCTRMKRGDLRVDISFVLREWVELSSSGHCDLGAAA